MQKFLKLIVVALSLVVVACSPEQYRITVSSNDNHLGMAEGGGTYERGDLVTLTATPLNGAVFVQWSNGAKLSQFSFEAEADADYVATFVLQYTLTLRANEGVNYVGAYKDAQAMNAGNADVKVDGHNRNVTAKVNDGAKYLLHAVADSSYKFKQWSDGNTDNPREITITGNAQYAAQFVKAFTVTTAVNNSAYGEVRGGGKYEAGDVAELSAIANNGYTFVQWQDGGTSNPRRVTVDQDMYFAATFQPVYTLTVRVDPASTGSGTVSNSSGTYAAGSRVNIQAVPAEGSAFAHWTYSNSNASRTYETNPAVVNVNENCTVSALFKRGFTITVLSDDERLGTVSGGGSYVEGGQATLTATPTGNNTFLRWNDGNTQNPRTVTVTGNATYTAHFTQRCTISTSVSPQGSGSVSGGGTYDYGQSAILTATAANSSYQFVRWSDGNTQNPRTVQVRGDASYVAEFGRTYTITANTNNAAYGSVSGGGIYVAGSTCTLRATPAGGYGFKRWNDGSRQNPRSFTVTGNATYTATMGKYVLTATAEYNMGTVSGSGEYSPGAVVTLTATPYSTTLFSQWSDGNRQNPRIVTINSDTSFTAQFVNAQALRVRSADTTMGTVLGSGTYIKGSTTTITAIPKWGYAFKQWQDGDTHRVRTITISQNSQAEYTATFTYAPVRTYTVGGVSFKMIYVEGGTFNMGANATVDRLATVNELYQHQVTLTGFYISETVVSEGLYAAVMGSQEQTANDANFPVSRASRSSATRFVTQLNNRLNGATFDLPTEAEWEYAARGGNKSQGYLYAGTNDSTGFYSRMPWVTVSYGDGTTPCLNAGRVDVGIRNELGLYNMSGQVAEWVKDDWENRHSMAAVTDPVITNTSGYGVIKGRAEGIWQFRWCRTARITARHKVLTSNILAYTGIRIVLHP